MAALTDEVAEALAKFKGDYLQLGGLTTLSDKAAEALAKYAGSWKLWLGGLTTLSDEAEKALRSNPKVELPKKIGR